MKPPISITAEMFQQIGARMEDFERVPCKSYRGESVWRRREDGRIVFFNPNMIASLPDVRFDRDVDADLYVALTPDVEGDFQIRAAIRQDDLIALGVLARDQYGTWYRHIKPSISKLHSLPQTQNGIAWRGFGQATAVRKVVQMAHDAGLNSPGEVKAFVMRHPWSSDATDSQIATAWGCLWYGSGDDRPL